MFEGSMERHSYLNLTKEMIERGYTSITTALLIPTLSLLSKQYSRHYKNKVTYIQGPWRETPEARAKIAFEWNDTQTRISSAQILIFSRLLSFLFRIWHLLIISSRGLAMQLYSPVALRAAQYTRSISFSQALYGNGHLFNYTSGQWLWNERQQLNARYSRFNVSSLMQAAGNALDSTEDISLENIDEDNYNKSYRLVIQNDRKIIAKMLHFNADSLMCAISSEIATMNLVEIILSLSVSKVLTWSATDQNLVESKYIITKEAKDFQLHKVWQDLNLRAKRDIIREIVDLEKKMFSVSFDRYIARLFLYHEEC